VSGFLIRRFGVSRDSKKRHLKDFEKGHFVEFSRIDNPMPHLDVNPKLQVFLDRIADVRAPFFCQGDSNKALCLLIYHWCHSKRTRQFPECTSENEMDCLKKCWLPERRMNEDILYERAKTKISKKRKFEGKEHDVDAPKQKKQRTGKYGDKEQNEKTESDRSI